MPTEKKLPAKKKPRQKYMFDLFAGCGGLSAGLEVEALGNFKPLLVSELSPDALDSYLANRSFKLKGKPFNQRRELHFQDVYTLTPEKMKALKGELTSIGLLKETEQGSSLDLICGGPPCQGYSGIGHRRSYSVEKKDIPSNQLYEKMAEIIEYYRPKVFLFENVKGLLSARWTAEGNKGEIWEDVLGRYRQIEGYEVRWSVVHAKDYGVPQNRPRVLMVGIRQDVLLKCAEFADPLAHPDDAVKCGFLPKGTGGAPDPEELLSDLLDPAVADILENGDYPADFATRHYLKAPKKGSVQEQLRRRPDGTLMAKGSELTEQEYSKHKVNIVLKFKHMLENEGEIPFEYQTKKFAQRVIPRKWPPQGPTITATSLPDDYVHYSQSRSLTVREWARLQMFPDWYEFKGKRTTGGLRRAGNPREGLFDRETPKYTQIGNAVAVALAARVGEHFSKLLG